MTELAASLRFQDLRREGPFCSRGVSPFEGRTKKVAKHVGESTYHGREKIMNKTGRGREKTKRVEK